MSNTRFLIHKILRQIELSGQMYEFTVIGEDDYHQLIEKTTVSIRGLYHETNKFIQLETTDATEVQRKKSPMILTLMGDDVKQLVQGSKVSINNVNYKVAGVLDIQNYGMVADISLEMEV